MKKFLLFLTLLALYIPAQSGAKVVNSGYKTWVVYYTNDIKYDAFYKYNVVVFDSDTYPNFKKRNRSQVILGYLSTSEAETYRSYFQQIQGLGVLLSKSELWDEHYAIDIRNPVWREYFIHTLVPQVLAKGFDGIFLDTIDSAIDLEEQDPEKYAGMKLAAVQLIQELRQAYPNIKLLMNRGFPLLPDVAKNIDYVLAESARVEHNFTTGKNKYFPQPDYDSVVRLLKAAKKQNSHLQVLTLDYWYMNRNHAPTIRKIYAEQRKNGFIPYVADPALMRLYPEP